MQQIASSEALRHAYTSVYYLTDCGGYDEYSKTGGQSVADERLSAVAAIASLKTSGRVLDLGCGRGELAFYFASLGHEVTAIDYSRDAIDLAEKTFVGREDLRRNVELTCANVCTVALHGEYDIVLASDVIEHLTPLELDSLYRRVASHLSPRGIFVVHTYPNLWYFEYDYPRKRRMAAARGESLPEQPRTRFELLMHINEQNPRTLRRQLSRHFPHVRLWFGEPANMGGSLLRPFSRHELAGARDLCAIASKQPTDLDALRSRLQSHPLLPVWVREVRLSAIRLNRAVVGGSQVDVEVELDNRSPVVLCSAGPHPVNITYRWLRSDGTVVVQNGLRSTIGPPVVPGTRRRFTPTVIAPVESGSYLLRLTLVQEGVQWFDVAPLSIFCDVPIEVPA
jgi:SAM-dependent methyltransferase